jgi:hypothetical protein
MPHDKTVDFDVEADKDRWKQPNCEGFVVDPMWPEGAPKPGEVGLHPDATGLAPVPAPASKPEIVMQDWQSLSRSLGLELYERQPEETDNEWRAWMMYREYYPGKLPTMSELSKKTGYTVATLVKYSQKWNWKVRMLHWSRATDATIQSDRVAAIKDMNRKQLQISQTMMDKLVEAMDYLDPATMKPSEITNMMKFATGLQKDIISYTPEQIDQPGMDMHAVKQSQVTKKEDLGSVAEILASVGLLDGKQIGIRTTEVVIQKEEGNE